MISQRPNILIILSDQLRRDALGVYGDANVSTPNIDQLALDGVRFTQACSTYPICVPFRFTMMTGAYAHSRYVPAIQYRMSPAERTLADEFNEADYHTVYIGKWHLYAGHGILPDHPAKKSNLTPVPRIHQGRWQKWLAFECANAPFNTYYFEDDDPTPRRLEKYQTDGLFDLAMDYLSNRKDVEQPFCCVLSVEPPHFPLEAPPELEKKWRDRPLKLPPNFMHKEPYDMPGWLIDESEREESLTQRRTYYAMIENLDENVGRMRSFLRENGMADNTIIVFLSDHGQMDGSHSVMNILKDHPFEESIGIPLIICDPRYPHRSGTAIGEPTSTEDLFPTLLGMAGLKPAHVLPGFDLSPLVRGEEEALSREGVYLEFVHDLRDGRFPVYHRLYWRGFRSPRYKYTVLGDAKEGGKPWQFFDLENDPYEMNNLIDSMAHTDEIEHHHRLLRQRAIDTADHYVLAPAFGLAGLNLWQ